MQTANQGRYVRFQPNVPETVTLRDLGTNVQVNFGPQVRYALADGKSMFLNPEVDISLGQLNPQIGESFTITKKTTDSDRFNWFIERAAQAVRRPQPAAEMLHRSESLDGEVMPSVPPNTRLESALKTAVAAAAAAEKYGSGIGYTCRFTPADIRSMGISVYIGMTQGAR